MTPSRLLGSAALALALGLAFAAPAEARDDHRRGHDRAHSSQDWRRGQDRRADHRRDYRRSDQRHDRRYDARYDRRHDRRDVRVVHAPPRHVVVHRPPVYRAPPPWARGYHYRHAGYAPTYVVHDYGYYGLGHPPRGYHWRRSDAGDFLMVAIATGIIADIILSR